ncbi:hypothetical protein KUCAC02_019931, partial [Chaenocephalus aceratus]
RECGGGEPGIQIPEGGSINVLIRTQGERFKVLQDDEGRSDGKPELIVFSSSRLIAEKDLTRTCRETPTVRAARALQTQRASLPKPSAKKSEAGDKLAASYCRDRHENDSMAGLQKERTVKGRTGIQKEIISRDVSH